MILGIAVFLIMMFFVVALHIADKWSENNYVKRKEQDSLNDKYQREKKWWEV